MSAEMMFFLVGTIFSSFSPPTGVVIDESPLVATLQPGDVVSAWRSSYPTSEPTYGKIENCFDWENFLLDASPRGRHLLSVSRDGQDLAISYQGEPWIFRVRPRLDPVANATLDTAIRQANEGQLTLMELGLLDRIEEGSARSENVACSYFRLLKELRKLDRWESVAWLSEKVMATAQSELGKIYGLEATGEATFANGDVSRAGKLMQEVLLRRKAARTGILEEAFTLTELAVQANAVGKGNDAARLCLEALEILEQFAPASIALARGYECVGSTATDQDHLQLAREYLEKAQAILENLAPDSAQLANLLLNRAVLAEKLHDLPMSEALIYQAMEIHLRNRDHGHHLADVFYALGQSRLRIGDYEGAESRTRQALEIQLGLSAASLDSAKSFNALGQIALRQGNPEQAYEYFRRALDLKLARNPQSPTAVRALMNLGSLFQDRGQLHRAQELYEEALALQREIDPADILVVTILNNLGTLHRDLKDYPRALRLFEEALKLQDRPESDIRVTATINHNLGATALNNRNWLGARQFLEKALAIREQFLDQTLPLAATLFNLGTLAYQANGDIVTARVYHQRALQIREKLAPDSLLLTESLGQLALLAGREGRRTEAIQLYFEAISKLETYFKRLGGSQDLKAEFRAAHARYYVELIDLLVDEGRESEAFAISERLKAQTFLSMFAERDHLSADLPIELEKTYRQTNEDYTRTWKSLAGLSLKDASQKVTETRRNLERLAEKLGDLEAEVRARSPALAAVRYPLPLDAGQARAGLDEGTLLLSYVVGEESTFLFWLTAGREARVARLPFGNATLTEKVEAFLDRIFSSAVATSLRSWRAADLQIAGSDLLQTLTGPAMSEILTAQRLLIVPDGPLSRLPFGALQVEGQRYLTESVPIYYSLSASVFREIRARRPAEPSGTDWQKEEVQIFVRSHFAMDSSVHSPSGRLCCFNEASDLPFAEVEARNIAAAFRPGIATTFSEREATEGALFQNAAKARILHFATHTMTTESLPRDAALLLAPDPDSTDPQLDGLLHVREVFDRLRLNAHLVVLSACDTATGQDLGNEGVLGLTRAFQYAGAQSVLASLWQVSDSSTATLMAYFYRHLADGENAANALRAAQIEILAASRTRTGNGTGTNRQEDVSPYAWAAFQLYGDWQ